MTPEFILYTYQTVLDASQPSGSRLDCHAYGPTSDAIARAKSVELAERAIDDSQPTLGYMVLELEGLPE